MGVAPHALYSRLRLDLQSQLEAGSVLEITQGRFDWPGISFKERAAGSLWSSLFRKADTGMTSETQTRALNKFLAVDQNCKEWKLPEDMHYGDDYLLNEFKNSVYRFWNPRGYPLVDHPFDLLAKAGLGPGASIGSPGDDFYTKLFSSRLSCTSLTLYHWYKRYIRGNSEWSNAENTRLVSHGVPDIVVGNRLSFVPKNDDISRSICTEPTLNMFYQLGFGRILQSRITDYFGINLETQQFKNRELARIGSWDGSFATIDLSSASDSISILMLREFIPRDFLSLLMKFRSPVTELPNGKLHDPGMISTMGNGFTFPLQTMLFSCVVLSAMKCSGLAPVLPHGLCEGNFGVNGDDLVVPTSIYWKVVRLLSLLGFTCNVDKTFVEGPFRESCGGDYFQGRNLRGVYIKRLLEPQDLYSVVNQLNLFSTRTGILLPRTVQFLLSKVRFLPVPRWEKDDAGIKVPLSIALPYLGFDKDLQSILYFAWEPSPPPKIRIADSCLFVPKSFKPRNFNLSGLFLCFLQGSVNSNSIPLKPKRSFYKRKPRVSPNWETSYEGDISSDRSVKAMTIHLYKGWFDWERWKTVTYMNLFM